MGAVVTGRPVESAWLLHSERKRTNVDTPMVKHTWKIWSFQDGFNKVRKHEKSRQLQKNHRLLNATQISFYHCTALLLSGPKHE